MALWSGAAASALSALALVICGKIEEDSFAGPVNGPSQWLWGPAEAYTRRGTWRHTVTGYAIHHVASVVWAVCHELMFPAARHSKTPTRCAAEAVGTTIIACAVDYGLTPERFRPGFRKHLGPVSLFVVYGAFAAGLALATAPWRVRGGQRICATGGLKTCRVTSSRVSRRV